ncbi:MAG TPA: hydroxymethylglutaryl-CoA lyase [Vicinamibacterales bacterium]|nr:hydroxymethylglutaryl-CoA lyase [Vicinamibacterales bacterium]
MRIPPKVTVVEVGPRDGLQNERASISTADKIAFVDRLTAAGHQVIEVSAFVSPRWVPQMADAADVFGGITRRDEVRYTALVPNLPGLERAIGAGVSEVAIFAAASDTFSRKNINQTIEESLTAYAVVCATAAKQNLRVRGYLSTCFVCPFEGRIDPARVTEIVERLLDIGVYQVAISDTIGAATPGDVVRVLDSVDRRFRTFTSIALHLHDTRGTALANVLAGLDAGVTTFDTSAGGLGGCPFAPGAAGNLATEDLLYMLNGFGIETGVDIAKVADASRFIESKLDRALPSRYLRAPQL